MNNNSFCNIANLSASILMRFKIKPEKGTISQIDEIFNMRYFLHIVVINIEGIDSQILHDNLKQFDFLPKQLLLEYSSNPSFTSEDFKSTLQQIQDAHQAWTYTVYPKKNGEQLSLKQWKNEIRDTTLIKESEQSVTYAVWNGLKRSDVKELNDVLQSLCSELRNTVVFITSSHSSDGNFQFDSNKSVPLIWYESKRKSTKHYKATRPNFVPASRDTGIVGWIVSIGIAVLIVGMILMKKY